MANDVVVREGRRGALSVGSSGDISLDNSPFGTETVVPKGLRGLAMSNLTQDIEVLLELMGRLDWSAEQLANHRTEKLRELLTYAVDHSGFWKERLTDIDIAAATVDDLAQIPPLTKEELMARWDDIVTVPGLTLDRCRRHLADLPTRPTPADFMLEGCVVLSTGGTSGTQAVVVNDLAQWERGMQAFKRWPVRRALALGRTPDPNAVIASVMGDSPRHFAGALSAATGLHGVAVTLPLTEQCAVLETIQPEVLLGYASVLERLASAALDGHLHISPTSVSSAGECLTPEVRARITAAWPAVSISDGYGSTECGMFAASSGADDPSLYINDDLYVFESLAAEGHPVAGEEVGTSVAVTCLEARALPLIRYELTDRVSFCTDPSPEGLAYTRIHPPGGRTSDWLHWDNVDVHPYAFATPLTDDAAVDSYQVRQTSSGAEILITPTGAPRNDSRLLGEIEAALRTAGMESPELSLICVDNIGRVGDGQKHRRFVPLD